MASGKGKRSIEHYTHPDKERVNNPPVGLVTPETDRDAGPADYAYDPHLDPALHWAGKAERTSFEVPTVSLHVHERIDPRSIIEAVRQKNGEDYVQGSLFSTVDENPPIRKAIEFYRHRHNWSNRLIAGDSLLVMNSLLEKEAMAGKVQMIYMDPPYGITYGSNFQPFVNKRNVKDGKDQDLTAEPEMIKAFRDTWELGIHSYLTYMRDRLFLARDLLHETGSLFVQISDENVHYVRALLDEVFGRENFVSQIAYRTSGSLSADVVSGIYDILLWYAKDRGQTKIRSLFTERPQENSQYVELADGTRATVKSLEQVPTDARYYTTENLVSSGYTSTCIFPIEFEGRTFNPSSGKSWKTTEDGIRKLKAARRLQATGRTVRYVLFYDDYPVHRLTNLWTDLAGAPNKIYAVQTNPKVVQRCMLMTTDPGDLVFDPTSGSGTTAVVAEEWGRRWIACDTSRVSVTLAKQRVMSSVFDYYELAHPHEGVSSGFAYKSVPHITLGSIANNPEITEGMDRESIDTAIDKYAEHETLYDQPLTDGSRARVTGPFTVEAVPAPAVKPLHEVEPSDGQPADAAVARTGETQRQGDWRDELLKTGIRAKGGQSIDFSRVEPLPGTRWLHADGETKEDTPRRVVVSFGPDHAPLEQRQVALAIEEAQALVPKPTIVVFAAFQFDPEAAKDIDETNWPGVTLLKVQMNADLLTDDLKKKRASNESFWLIGQPDVELEAIAKGPDAGKFRVSINGFDYYNTRTGDIESGGADKIAMWMLDPDYDGRSLLPRQVFFIADVMSNSLKALAKGLRAEIDEELIQAYFGTTSLPFGPGENRRAAVKIIDDRGIESFIVIGLE
ncbi:MAG TPA: site-specific DNA-methyltransferase [Pirellulaceae bacterium]|nr:site-specific DNA-methyltransferase [Pirellulaceae bacterium]